MARVESLDLHHEKLVRSDYTVIFSSAPLLPGRPLECIHDSSRVRYLDLHSIFVHAKYINSSHSGKSTQPATIPVSCHKGPTQVVHVSARATTT